MQTCFCRLIVYLMFGCAVIGLDVQTYAAQGDVISLAGTWRFALDRDDNGIDDKWYDCELSPEHITLPGVLQGQGYGDLISTDTPWVLSLYDRSWFLRKEYKEYAQSGNTKVPFLSQPPRHYLGAAWYQRTIEIPSDWQERQIELFLERTRWKTTVWIDNQEIGSRDSLVAPHTYELGRLHSGSYRLTIRVDNRMQMDYRPDAHSVSDSLGNTWNGIVGKIELVSKGSVWIDEIRAFPNIEKKSVILHVTIGNATNQSGEGTLKVGDTEFPISWTSEGGHGELEISLGKDAELWSEFNPKLYHLMVHLQAEKIHDSKEVTFGLRQISTDDHHLLVNGQRSHFRGTHFGGSFPKTGYPATDVEFWRNLFKTCKQWGLNHMRFHSFCPPEAAFTAADETGMYLQPEAGMWNHISPGTEMEKRVYDETERMIRAYGNHPSFVLFSPSNEPKGNWKESLTRWVDYYRRKDPRRLYTTGTGWPLIERPGHVEGADYLAVHRIGRRRLRGSRAWFGRNYLDSMREVDVPIIVHELGQWCAYPDFGIIDKFTGYMKSGNYEIFRNSMVKAGLLEMNKDFANASGCFQTACYKEEIEANLRTPGLAGFQLLDLHDYLGQGTALIGVLDAFWEEKGYVTADQWRRFCNTTVPLAILKKRIFTTDDPFEVDLQIAHYGPLPIENANVYWKIKDQKGQILQNGQWQVEKIEQGSAIALGQIEVDLSTLPNPEIYKLIVGLSGTPFENDWNFWLYPEEPVLETPEDIITTRSFTQANDALSKGQKVLLMPLSNHLHWNSTPIGWEPIFWNRQMGPTWERFLGLVCNPEHPALAAFATDFHYDWQWRDVFRPYCRAINLDALDARIKPIVQIIDDWNRNYKLAAVFECKVGKGKLLMCAADLNSNLSDRPVAAQLRQSLLDYMKSENFNPSVDITPEQLMGLHFDNQIVKRLGGVVNAAPDSGGYSIANVIDGNPNTYWTTAGRLRRNKYPYEFTLSFPAEVEMTGLIFMNRQDHRQREGDVRDYVIEMSADSEKWSVLTKGSLESTFDPQRLDFGKKIATRFLKIRTLSGFGNDSLASLAEIGILYAGPSFADKTLESTVYRKTVSATEEMYEAVDPLQSSSNPAAAKIERITADSESATNPAEYAFDGDPKTFWNTDWREKAAGHPHWLMVELKEAQTISGIRYLPARDRSNGWIKDYHIETSMDGDQWQTVAKGTFTALQDEQIIKFEKSIHAKYLKVTAESEYQDRSFTSISEFIILSD